MKIFLPCLRESAVISYPVQDWTKQGVFKTLQTAHSENYVIKGGEKENILYGDDPV